MPRGSRGGGGDRGGDAHDHAAGQGADTEDARALGAFLRDLAARAEHDPALAASLRDALRASGLLDAAGHPRRGAARSKPPSSTGRQRRTNRDSAATTASAAAISSAGTGEAPDPFVLLRERGEAGLRTALDALDLAALRAIVRGHRLDPARISARWTARERVIDLIVKQVRGHANRGKAFAHL